MKYFALQIFFSFLLYSYLPAQSNSVSEKAWGKEVINRFGEDDLLVNGRRYFPAHPRAKGHPFLLTDNWTTGQVYVKGRTYEQQQLKFDVEQQQLLLKYQTLAGGFETIMLNKALVDSFRLGQHFFVNAIHLLPASTSKVFYEQVYAGDFKFLIQHGVTFKSTDIKYDYVGRYMSLAQSRYLLINDQLVKVQSKKSLLKAFKPNKAEIKRFLKKNKIKYKKATSNELFLLMKYCDSINQ